MGAPQILEVGELVTLKSRFTNSSGVLTDPTTVNITVTDPTGTVVANVTTPNAAISHPSTGLYTFDLTVTTAGVYSYRWTATGAVVSGETAYLIVHPVGYGGARSGPMANWATIDQLQACGKVPTGATEGAQEQALSVASDLLYRWSGYKYPGLGLDLVRPCAQNSFLEYQPTWDRPIGWTASWGWNTAWGTCLCQASSHRGCGCRFLPEVKLGRNPVAGIVQVKQDGATLASTAYRLDDYGWLLRRDGLGWPCCQDLTLDDTQPNTWSVQFIWGKEPPPAGVQACIDLAQEVVTFCAGGDCTLPREVSTLIRQGETAIFPLPGAYGKDAAGIIRAGLKSVDRFLGAVGTSRPAVIASPDVDAMVRRTAT